MRYYGLLIAALLPLSFVSLADDFTKSNLLKELKTQLANKDYAAVLVLTDQYSDQYLGEPEFDFILGVAALESNRVDLSVFALERVVNNKPTWQDAKLYLAKAYFDTANYQSAIEQCENILATIDGSNKLYPLAVNLCSKANQKLARQSTFFRQGIKASFGHDSNINAGTQEERIFLPILDDFINLDEASTEKSDEFAQLNYQFNMSTALTQTSKLSVTTQLNALSFMNETDYNRLVAQLGVDYSVKAASFDVNVGGRITPLWFDGHYYRMQSALVTGIKTKLSDNWTLSGSLMAGKTNNNQNKRLDTNDYSIGLGSSYYQGNWRHSVNIEHLDEDGELDSNSRTIDSISVNSLWLLNQQWLTSASLSFQDHDYKGNHPFYLQKRQDNISIFSTFVQYTFSQLLTYRLNINMQDKDSNLDLFSYDRAEISLSAQMSF
ncbi:surface lipoprotein assembly modifier [Thalassotalea piscium]